MVTKIDLVKALRPILLTDWLGIGDKVPSTDVPKVLFLPKFCNPPTGWFIKLETTTENYILLYGDLGTCPSYGVYNKCIEQGQTTLEPWFRLVNPEPNKLIINIIEGNSLFDSLPTIANTSPPLSESTEDLDPLYEMIALFLEAMVKDAILSGISGKFLLLQKDKNKIDNETKHII